MKNCSTRDIVILFVVLIVIIAMFLYPYLILLVIGIGIGIYFREQIFQVVDAIKEEIKK